MTRAQAKEIGIATARSGPLRIVREQHHSFVHQSGQVTSFYPLYSVETRQPDGSYALALVNGRQNWYADWTKAEAWLMELDNLSYWTPLDPTGTPDPNLAALA